MTTPVETVTTKTRKAPTPKRGFNDLGKFFAKIRIDLDMTTAEWAKALGVSQLAITNVERGNNQLSFDLVLKITKLIQEKAPHYEGEFASIIANQLNVLIIPAYTDTETVALAYNILVNGIPQETGSCTEA